MPALISKKILFFFTWKIVLYCFNTCGQKYFRLTSYYFTSQRLLLAGVEQEEQNTYGWIRHEYMYNSDFIGIKLYLSWLYDSYLSIGLCAMLYIHTKAMYYIVVIGGGNLGTATRRMNTRTRTAFLPKLNWSNSKKHNPLLICISFFHSTLGSTSMHTTRIILLLLIMIIIVYFILDL